MRPLYASLAVQALTCKWQQTTLFKPELYSSNAIYQLSLRTLDPWLVINATPYYLNPFGSVSRLSD